MHLCELLFSYGTSSVMKQCQAKDLFDEVKLGIDPRIDEMQRSSKSQKRLITKRQGPIPV